MRAPTAGTAERHRGTAPAASHDGALTDSTASGRASGPRAPGPHGTLSPSNVLLRDDGDHDAMYVTIPDRDDPPRRGSCVIFDAHLDRCLYVDAAGVNLGAPTSPIGLLDSAPRWTMPNASRRRLYLRCIFLGEEAP